jgi:hypothetical protein
VSTFRRRINWLLGNTVAGLIVTGLGALLATVLGVRSSLEPPWNYTFAYGVAALVAASVVWYVQGQGWQLPAPWGTTYKPVAERGHEAASVLKTDSPDPGWSIVQFELRGLMDQRVPIGRRARAVEFLEPIHKIVKKADLPERVRWRLRTIAVVKGFTQDAVILDSHVQRVPIRAQIHYSEDGDS